VSNVRGIPRNDNGKGTEEEATGVRAVPLAKVAPEAVHEKDA
jgi:hypothetical protein